MDVRYEQIFDKGQRILTYSTIGGIIDFKFFLGNSANDAVKQYHKYLGGWG